MDSKSVKGAKLNTIYRCRVQGITKKVGEINPPTQDELPYKAFAGSLLSAMQIYDKNN